MDILAKLKASRTTVKPVKLGDIALGLRILTERDYQEAGWAANELLAAHEAELSAANADLFESQKATHLIARFVVDPVTRAPVFASADMVLDLLSRAERNLLGDAYYDFEKEFSPSERTMSDADLTALLEDVKKKPDPTVLNDLSGALLKKLIISLAARPTS